MRSAILALLLLGAGCGARTDKPVASAAPTYAPADVDWSAMVGTLPATPRGPAEFTVTSHTGAQRTAADLLGKPTALWFYPKASTPG
ncbi:MAG: hypothetical protein JRI25_26525 [Deltaproteobacteria bacterium]|nr:hypothetical protein [Deltaproteobacteria bacterium]